MKRYLITQLLAWKNKKDRKPLILKGARQVGKTYLLKAFGEEHFPRTYYVNFEKNPVFAELFTQNLDPHRIIDALNFHFNASIDIQHDLVIFDEIQACPNALTSLKYFQEDMPELALCAAGSLLGIHLNSGSFPVGKVDFMVMYPMSFTEFLLGIGDDKSVEFMQNITLESTIPELVHQHLWERCKRYLIVGGLPEAISTYAQHQDSLYLALEQVRNKQEELIQAYYADIAKHSGKVNAMHIDRVWRAIPRQLARNEDASAGKFKFKGIISGIDRYSRLDSVIDWLESAGLILKIHITHSAQLPLLAYTKENVFKLLAFDVGILGAMSDLSPKAILDYDYGTYKGYFAENFVAQEFLVANGRPLYSWQEGTAEIEFLREVDGKILPVEVKSGWITQAKSLKAFAQKYNPDYKTIISANNLFIDDKQKTHRYPLYLAGQFPLSA